jgi:hypothetical protein
MFLIRFMQVLLIYNEAWMILFKESNKVKCKINRKLMH